MQVGRHAGQIRFKIHRTSEILRAAAKGNMEKDSVRTDKIRTQTGKNQPAKNFSSFIVSSLQKGGDVIGFDGFKRVTGTKLHAAVDGTGLPVSIVMSPAGIHDGTKFADVMEPVSDFADDSMTEQMVSAHADRGYGSKPIRSYARSRDVIPCIPFGKNGRTAGGDAGKDSYDRTRFVAERFLARLKNGFHRAGIRCERNAGNYPGLVSIASFLMYCRVLR